MRIGITTEAPESRVHQSRRAADHLQWVTSVETWLTIGERTYNECIERFGSAVTPIRLLLHLDIYVRYILVAFHPRKLNSRQLLAATRRLNL